MEILEARVIQKVGTESEWLANPLPLLNGEAAIVRRADGTPVNLKFGLDGKTFAELPYFIDYSQAAYIAYEATPTQPIAYTFVGEGTYGSITVAEGCMAVLGWDGTSWSKNAEILIPQAENKIDEWIAGTYSIGEQRVYNGQIWEVIVTSTSSTPGVNGDWKPISGESLVSTSIYSQGTDVVSGEWIPSSNGIIETNVNGKRTKLLLIGDEDFEYIEIKGRDVFFAGIYFRDSSGNPVSYISRPGNAIITKGDITSNNIKGIILNLKNPSDGQNRDISNTLSVNVFRKKALNEINSKITNIENNFARKEFSAISYKNGDNIDGFNINSAGVLIPDAGYSYGEINLKNVRFLLFENFSSGLRTKYLYNDKKEFLFSVDKLTNGLIDLNGYNQKPYYVRFLVKTPTIPLKTDLKVTSSGSDIISEVDKNGYSKLSEVYQNKNKSLPLYFNYDEIITGAGNIGASAGGAWTGLVDISGSFDYLEISGVPSGLNTKAFFNEFGIFLNSITINNGIINKADINPNAKYLGFNVKTTTAGDGTSTAKVVMVKDDLKGVGIPELSFGIPSLIPVVVGTQMNLYNSNLALKPFNDKTELFWLEGAELNNSKVNPFVWKTVRTERSLQYTPTVGNEVIDITARCRTLDYQTIGERKFKLKSIPNTGGNNERKVILLFGDSQIDTTFDLAKSSLAPYLKDLFVQSGDIDAVFVGTQEFSATIYGNAVENNRYITCRTEAYGGTTYPYFYQSTSPFWSAAKNDTDFVAWLESMRNISGNPMGLQAGDVLDYVFCPCGANDFLLNYPQLDPTPIIERAKIMMQKVWQDYPNCKYILGMPTMGSYYWGQDYRRRWNIAYFEAVVKEFEKPEYAGKVLIASEGLWNDDLYANRIVRPYREPYARIVDTKNQLINKLKQSGFTEEQAIQRVVNEYGLEVKERVLEKWQQEYGGTNDVTHSGYVGAMQQADCIYAVLRGSIMGLI